MAEDDAARGPALTAGVPRWMVWSGTTGWLLVGLAGAAAVLISLVGFASALLTPLMVAIVLAILFSPVLDQLERRRVPRIIGGVLVLLGLVAATAFMCWAVLAGIIEVAPQIGDQLRAAREAIASGLTDLGLDPSTAEQATESTGQAAGEAVQVLLSGALSGIRGISSAAFQIFTGAVILLFLLLHPRRYVQAVVRFSGTAPDVIGPVLTDCASAIRGYFRGTAIIALSNAIPIAITAWLIDVPLVGTIALVTFVTAFIPYFGAIIAGFFVCLIALGTQGADAAIIMLVVILLVNNVLQNFFAPVAYGSSLDLDPLVVLLVTTAAGLIGGVGLIVLAAPVTAVVQRSVRRFTAAKAERRQAEAEAEAEAEAAAKAEADSSPSGEAAPAPLPAR
jgi:predicted PurR-regulated permease PerM